MRTETSLLASTREQNLLLRAQAALLAPVLIHIGTGILRYGLVIVLVWIGGMKFTAYEAAGIALVAMNFDCGLARAQFRANLLIE